MNDEVDIKLSLYRNYTPTAAAVWVKAIVIVPPWTDKTRQSVLKQIINWCDENCTGKWTYSNVDYANHQSYYFKNKRDQIAFLLVWSDFTQPTKKP